MKKILPHLCIILSVVLLVFLVIDQVNSAMIFINNQGTKIMMMVLCASTLLTCVLYIRDQRRR